MRSSKGLFFSALATTAMIAVPAVSFASTRVTPVHGSTYRTSQRTDACNQAPPATRLGSQLAPFALLAGTTITNVGNTVVTYTGMPKFTGVVQNDAVGVSPGTAITGFYPPGVDRDGVNAIYAAGYNTDRATPALAEAALANVYTRTAGLTPTMLVSGDLSQAKVPGYPMGTLPPGIYKANTTLSIMSGNLTLQGVGTLAVPSAWVFLIGTTLTTTGNGVLGGNVVLANGANACNVDWQVGTSATLGGSAFAGNVFADTSITLGADTLSGRALAINGAVTLTSAGGTLITNPGGR
jgi:hypothetical protein